MTPIISRPARSLALLIAASGLLLTACGGPEPQTPTPPEPPVTVMSQPVDDAITIVVLGDSLAAGMGLAEADAFPAGVEALLREAGRPVQVLNATAGGLSRIDWVLKQRPEILVVELGGNDALRGQSLENTEGKLRQIIQRGRDGGARVVLLGMDVPTNYGPDYAGAFAEMYERIARDERITLVPGFVREVGIDPELMQPDGLHPTAEGQRRLAATLFPYLEAIVQEIEASPGGE
jgi:acyl-CoA thioesterase-1